MIGYNLTLPELVDEMLFIDQTHIMKKAMSNIDPLEYYINLPGIYCTCVNFSDIMGDYCSYCDFDIENMDRFYLVNPKYVSIIKEGKLPYIVFQNNTWIMTYKGSELANNSFLDWYHLKKYCLKEYINNIIKLQALWRGYNLRWKIPVFTDRFLQYNQRQ